MLKKRALSATLWSGADVLLRQGLQFCTTLILARLLGPDAFGIIASLALFTGLASLFVDGGLSAALIQRQDVTRADESTVFWFNLLVGSFFALALFAIGPTIAIFYAQPVIAPLTAAFALNVFIGALGTIHTTLLSKRLNFRMLTLVGVTSTLVSCGVAIWMAWSGFGVWALAAQIIVSTAVSTLMLWACNSWRPTWTFSIPSARRLFGFGGYYFASILMEMTFSRLYTLLIGKIYGVRELGYFSNADTIKQMPSGFLAGVLSRVALPMFATAANDKALLTRGMQVAIRGMMLLNVPMMLGLMVLADSFVEAVLGSQWLPSVPILRVLCLGALLWPMHVINLNVLMAQGHSRLFFRLEIIKKVTGGLMLVGAAPFGVLTIAWSIALFSILAFGINAFYSGRLLGYGAGRQFRDFAPTLCISAVMASVVYVISSTWHVPALLKLVALIPLGALIFFVLAGVTGLHALREVLALFRRNDSSTHVIVPEFIP